jgi:hypothetical protein
MAKAKTGDILCCNECGLVVEVKEVCACDECEIICCEAPMQKKEKKPAEGKKSIGSRRSGSCGRLMP